MGNANTHEQPKHSPRLHSFRGSQPPLPAGIARLRAPPASRGNRLLASLTDGALADLLPALESVPLQVGQVLHESGESQTHVYFPTSGITALLYESSNGESIGFALVTSSDLIGTPIVTHGDSMPCRAQVICAGHAWRIRSSTLMQMIGRSAELQRLLLLDTLALITQITLTAACNRHHSVEQRLCQFLLQCLDASQAANIGVTQELTATLMGVRRETITQAAGVLQLHGVIRYRRGHIEVLDRAGLEARACECHAVVSREYDRLLPRRRAAVAA